MSSRNVTGVYKDAVLEVDETMNADPEISEALKSKPGPSQTRQEQEEEFARIFLHLDLDLKPAELFKRSQAPVDEELIEREKAAISMRRSKIRKMLK